MSSIRIWIPIVPRGKGSVRVGVGADGKPRGRKDPETSAYMRAVSAAVRRALPAGWVPIAGPAGLMVIAVLPRRKCDLDLPDLWWSTAKPDADNIAKAICDAGETDPVVAAQLEGLPQRYRDQLKAASKLLWTNDANISGLQVYKILAQKKCEPGLAISINECQNDDALKMVGWLLDDIRRVK